jgi:hypothetical protein
MIRTASAMACTLAFTFLLVACSKHLPLARPAAPLTEPTRLCTANEGPADCRPARQVEETLAGDLEILSMDDTPSGSQGAKILTVRGWSRGRSIVFRVRWRAQSSAGLINEPRKELAAYAVQKLYLSEEELVVPPTAAHCFPIEHYRHFAPTESATFPNADCVLGFVSLWLEGVKTVESAREADWLGDDGGIWDKKLFEQDAMYRTSVGNANLLTYLIQHGDAHELQFMLEKAPGGLRTYVVDNSIAFRSIKNPMLLLREDWSNLHVPSLPARAIARLEALTSQDLARLATITELELRGRQLSVTKQPFEASPSHPNELSWHGDRLRIGLTEGEIELVSSRVRDLLARPDLDRLAKP